MFQEYYQKGIVVIPLKEKGIPAIQWSRFFLDANYLPSEEEIRSWKHKNIALLCGEKSKIVAIDIDIDAPEKISLLTRIIGKTPCAKKGSKGITLFYKYNGEHSKSLKDKEGNVIVEILSDKRLTTIPPSKHRSKDLHYTWEGMPLLEAELPTLSSHYLEAIRKVFAIPEEVERVRQSYSYKETPELEKAQELLDYCNPDCDRIEWINIGSALRSCYGDGAFYMFDDWSAKSKKYNKKEIRNVWRSFQDGYSFGVIYNVAKKLGYQPEPITQKNIKTIRVEDWDKKKLEIITETIKESQALPEFYVNAPTHIKKICDWILSTAYYPQPIITLGGVLSFLSFVMGTNSELGGLKPNLYTILLAGTGTGKEHIIRCIWGMAGILDLKNKVSSSWTSDTAIIKRLKKNEGKTFYLTDEMYAVMQSLSRGNSNSRESAAAATLLKAYTGIKVETCDYADDKQRPTEVVENPFISIAGFSTPEPFFDAVGQKEAFSGFVGRLAVFEGSELLPEPNKQHNGNAWKEVPKDIEAVLLEIKNNIDRYSYKGKEITATKSIKLAEGVQETIDKMNEDIRKKRNEFKLEKNPMDNVIARMGELVLKYAIIASKGNIIELNDLLWAKSIAEYNLGIICAVSSQFTDSKFENKVAKLLSWIEKQGGLVNKTALTSFCRFFDNRREREETIQELIDREKIEVIKLEGVGQKKTGYKVKSPA